ncbi:HAD superfamily hydrolase [Streptococcus varani]|uniref:HAD superfamily hydrolase n=1 Tax=Streptococcus varani TaxID=1608583 RepID=A0A0E4CTA7_9STRE|nr:Cof-type HAD-IIB family hydrolase [Streptococcus varani]CQR25536.1 HAD superfamily hydrolase [Streptococcus varani]
MAIRKLFVTDLDGTFLRYDHHYDRVALQEILKQFKEKGYLFVAASGRSLLSLKKLFQGLEEDMAFLAENGSLLSYQGQMIFEDKPITSHVYLPLIEAIKMGPFSSTNQILLSAKSGAYVLNEVEENYFKHIEGYYPNLSRVEDFSNITEEIIKLVVTFPEEDLDAANRWLNEHFEGISSVTTGFDSVDIIMSDIHKAVALSKLCDHFGLSHQDVIAFGDNQNDKEMLEFAGTAVATENARDSIKAIADQVIGPCQDDAVIKYIQDYLKK